ncbi:MAG TPA: serine hydrolase [Micromonosporaceae bacterium]|nr:serine hydrolase [Micromonosporaceae bacterium]
MRLPPRMAALDAELATVGGTVSVWYGRPGRPAAYTRLPDVAHYAASTMKVAVLAAVYRTAEAGRLDLDAPVEVRNEFPSAAPGAPPFGCDRGYDNDEAVWQRLGGWAPLRWLARRMIVRSSNLATNICLASVGLDAVAEVWRRAGAGHSVVGRGIEDTAASQAGITNLVTAADLAALLGAVAGGGTGPEATAGPEAIAGPASCREMTEVLLAQEHRDDLAAGLPSDVPVAHKNGWVRGIRHGAGVVYPADAPPYAIVCCTTTPLATNDAGDEACRLLARVAAASWADRHALAG